jgi:hypothetical protein
MKVLMFGSRALTWKHLHVFEDLAWHSVLIDPCPLPEFIRWIHLSPAPAEGGPRYDEVQAATLINGDGPPGKGRGAIGADKVAVLACMRKWWKQEKRHVRWFPPEPWDGETWGQAAARRDIEMAEARPDRAYCVHTDLDASKGSIITAWALADRGIRFWYVRVTMAGDIVSMEER